MLYILLLYFSIQGAGTSSWECVALDGQRVPHGQTFVPGPDYCTVCKCEEGKPRLCQAVLCQPPQDCKSFRVGKSCCDFICLDDMLPKLPGDTPHATTDLGLRMVASAVTAILSLALLLFLIHRLRQRRLRAQQQYYEDPDSPVGPNVDSCHSNACCHNAAYCNGNDHVDFFLDGHTPPYSLWKPPSFYFSYEDAPPPYSEVVGSSYRLSESGTFPALGPLMVQLGPSPGESSDGQGVIVGASGSSFRRSRSPSRTPLNRNVVAIRSDEVYEDVNATPDELPPPYCPTAQPLNDLNQGIDVRAVGEQVATCSEVGCEGEGTMECSCSADEACCSLCSHSDSAAVRSNNAPQQEQAVNPSPVRLRTREVSRTQSHRGSNRTSTLEEFQLRLSMDISDSSTSSEGPTRTFSSSSEDSTSMDTTSEMR
ncbi:integral membrane protein DGCR2/IDD-like isoform X2 [Palaemon carinicauda]|uniref:integral membrane protein DGCR2/IDD-like isoform X2 n=1 Tax=Palaemon carinicauda TaxID=392227 RepID=UPI0035B637D8